MTNPNDPYDRDRTYGDPSMTSQDNRYARNAQGGRAGGWGTGSWAIAVIAVLIVIGIIYALSGPWNGRNSTATNTPPSTTGQGTNAPAPGGSASSGANPPAGQNSGAGGNPTTPAAPAQKQ